MLNNLGLHYLVQCDSPVYAYLTLEFLFTLEVNMFKAPDESSVEGTKLKTTGTLNFHKHNSDYQIPVETLEDLLYLPTDGEAMSPNLFGQMNYGPRLLEMPHILWRVPRSLIYKTLFLGTFRKFWHTLYSPNRITHGLLPLESYIFSMPW